MRSRRERTETARPALLELLRTRSFQRRNVVLASGKVSDFFIDCKQTVLTAEGHALVGELMLDGLRHMPACDAVAGVALGGCPLASSVSLMSQLRGRPMPALYVRKAQKDHGSQRLVEGDVQPNMKVVLLEDVITTGASSLKAVAALRSVGVETVGVLVLVDRLEGGAEALREAGLITISLYTRHDFISATTLEATLVDPISG